MSHNVGNEIKSSGSGGWSFSGIESNFDEHISLSVPLYKEAHDIALDLLTHYLPPGGNYYDIGCSTGSFAIALANRFLKNSVPINIFAIDIQQGMIDFAENKTPRELKESVRWIQASVTEYEFDQCAAVTSFYTMQFVNLDEREPLIKRIFSSLTRGGAFLMFEKVLGTDAHFQQLFHEMYQEYKFN